MSQNPVSFTGLSMAKTRTAYLYIRTNYVLIDPWFLVSDAEASL